MWISRCVQKLFNDGYSATDIITTLFRIVRNADLQEWIKLEYIKVRLWGRPARAAYMLGACPHSYLSCRRNHVLCYRCAVSRPLWRFCSAIVRHSRVPPQEIGFCHIRISDGVNSRLQLSGLLAKLCKLTLQARR